MSVDSILDELQQTIDKINPENLPGAERGVLDSLEKKLKFAFDRFQQMTKPIRDSEIASKWMTSFAENVNILYREFRSHNDSIGRFSWFVERFIRETQDGILLDLVDRIKEEKFERLLRTMLAFLNPITRRLDFHRYPELANHLLADYVTLATQRPFNTEELETMLTQLKTMEHEKIGKTEISPEKIISIQTMIRPVHTYAASRPVSRQVSRPISTISHGSRPLGSRPLGSPPLGSPPHSRLSPRKSTQKPSRFSRMRTGLGQMTSGITQRAHAFRKKYFWGGTRAFKARRLKR
jgi:hypothetical protein